MNKKRGPYKGTRLKMVKDGHSCFFREEHQNISPYITWADAVARGNGSVSILYKISGAKKQFRCPRYKTVWLDKYGIDFAKRIASKWKNDQNNLLGKGDFLPEYYLKDREDFIKWLGHTARHITIKGYESFLRMYVFPFFIKKLKIESPRSWDEDALARWNNFLDENVDQLSTRNRIRTGLRRYLKYLKYRNKIKRVPQIFNECKKRDHRETPIPGDLPEWSDILDWLNSLPCGRYRFIRAITMAFGLRISEACCVSEDDLFGAESENHINNKNDFIKVLKDEGIGKLFLYVDQAEKKKVGLDLIKILGEQDIEPKSGPYTACCTNKELAYFIVGLIENGEHLGKLSKDDAYRIKKEIKGMDSRFLFNKYRFHDDRRLNITLQMFDLKVQNALDICCLLHGQSSREVFNRYFQWGLIQRRKRNNSTRSIQIFS